MADKLARETKEYAKLVEEEIPKVHEIAQAASAELQETESTLSDREALCARLLQSLDLELGEAQSIRKRIETLDEDIQKNKDVRTLQTLGSGNLPQFVESVCPACHRSLEDTLLPVIEGQTVMSVDDNIRFLGEQRRTFAGVLANAERRVQFRERQVQAIREQASELRDRARALRQTLISDGRLPSIAAIQSRLQLENSIKLLQSTVTRFNAILEELNNLSKTWVRVLNELSSMPSDDTTDQDKRKINTWSRLLVEQLEQYGFRSLAPSSISMSPYTYRPEHEGFDLVSSISASDLIRTIWAYLHGMLELARESPTNHPGLLLFDEPRQQSTREVSFTELLRRASSAGDHKQQVIFFTSENPDNLRGALRDLPCKFIKIPGRVLKKL